MPTELPGGRNKRHPSFPASVILCFIFLGLPGYGLLFKALFGANGSDEAWGLCQKQEFQNSFSAYFNRKIWDLDLKIKFLTNFIAMGEKINKNGNRRFFPYALPKVQPASHLFDEPIDFGNLWG